MADLFITSDWFKRSEAAAIPGSRWSEEAGGWVVEEDSLTPYDKNVIMALFPDIGAKLDFDNPENLRPADLATPWRFGVPREGVLPSVKPDLLGKLHEYQVTDLGFLAARMAQDGGAYLGWDRGLGKTVGAIALAQQLRAQRVVVVCPNSAKELTWRPEFTKWYPHAEVFNFAGPPAMRERRLQAWIRLDSPMSVLLIHYEGLRLVKAPALKSDMVIVDEAHRLANGAARGSKVPKFYRTLRGVNTKHKLAMSGSVMNNEIDDMFGALHFILPKVYVSKYKDWVDRFVHHVPGTYSRRVPIGIKRDKVEELRNELATFMCVRHKEDELDMPELIEEFVTVQLTPTQRKVYDDLVEEWVAKLPDGDVLVADGVLSMLTKLRQVAAGLDLFGDVKDSVKLDYVTDAVMDNAPNKTVVFTWHKATAEAGARNVAAHGGNPVVVHGDVPMKRRYELIEQFRDDPECTALFATIKTLGESVNLQFASDVIFVESSWVPTDMQQARDRVYRQGQQHRVHVTHLIAEDTVDDLRVLPRVRSKAAMRQLVLGGRA